MRKLHLSFITVIEFLKTLRLIKNFKLPHSLEKLPGKKQLSPSERKWVFRVARHLCQTFNIHSTCLTSSMLVYSVDSSPVEFCFGVFGEKSPLEAHCWLRYTDGLVLSTDQQIPLATTFVYQRHAS